jgi:hypothetical protein
MRPPSNIINGIRKKLIPAEISRLPKIIAAHLRQDNIPILPFTSFYPTSSICGFQTSHSLEKPKKAGSSSNDEKPAFD